MKSLTATGLVAVWLVLSVDSIAFAQTRGSDRPYRALFGRGSPGKSGQSLNLSAVLVQAYDGNLLAEAGGITPGAAIVSGKYTMLQAETDYGWVGQRVQLGLTSASAFRYYGPVGDVVNVSQKAGIGLSATLSKRLTLAVNESAAYSPSYLSRLFPGVTDVRLGDAPPASPNYAVTDMSSYSYGTAVSLTRSIARRGSLSLDGDYTYTDFNGATALRKDGASYGGRVEFRRSVGRHSAFNTSYKYRTGDYGFASVGKVTEHGVEFGLEHTQVLSATRNAVYAFNIGAARSIIPPVAVVGTQPQGNSPLSNEQLYRVTGDGAFTYQFGRTGELRASYRRGVEYIVELTQPVFMDGVALSLSASPARRLEVITSAGYSSGTSVLQQAASRFDTYTADIQTHYRFSQLVSAYVEYLYYFYDFAANPLLAPNLPRRLERNGVRAGLMFSAPLVRR